MIPLYNTSDIRQLDSFAINKFKVPGTILMENASLGIFQTIMEKYPQVQSVGIICGKGNNGGDGFAVARHLSNLGMLVKVLHIGSIKEMSEDCKTNYKILSAISLVRKSVKLKFYSSTKNISWLKDCDLIIDAMLGSGFSGGLKDPYLSIVKKLNKYPAIKCAIDIPTGLNADTGFADNIFHSDLTITLGEFKKGLFIEKGYENCGEVVLKEIGIGNDYFEKVNSDTFLIEPEDVFEILPKRNKTVNKYSAGKVLSISGSYKFPGAPVLTSISALISGAGASILAIPESAKKIISRQLLEVVVETYGTLKTECFNEEAIEQLAERIKWADVLAIGPGLGRSIETKNAVRKLLADNKFKSAVIDADALNAIDNVFLDKVDLSNCILTPHMGEFAKLINEDVANIKKDILEFGRNFAVKHNTVLVLKGAPTIIFNKSGEAFINTSGNSGMAKFGSGDVLTGLLAGLISQSGNLENAAISAVYLHSLSADLLSNEKPISNYLPSDVMQNYPNAVKFLEGSIV